MRILIDINHPAHVHLFRNAVKLWLANGHKVLLITRTKDVVMDLVFYYNLPFLLGTKRRNGIITLGMELLEKTALIVKQAKQFRPDFLMSVASPPAAWASNIIGVPHIAFDDSEHKWEHMLYVPFSKIICTPDCFHNGFGRKQVYYKGYHELAYLHPNNFCPNENVLAEAGLSKSDRLFIVRFVSWQATHDIGERGFTLEGKIRLVKELERQGKVIITSESDLPPELKPYAYKIAPSKIHDLLYFSSLYIGEGATMASEAAVLGVPSIYINTINAGTLEEQERKYGLLHRITDEEKAISMAVNLASDEKARTEYREKARVMLQEKIDVTRWMVEFVENLVR